MDLKEKIHTYSAEVDAFEIDSEARLESFRIKFLGSKNVLKSLYKELKDIPKTEKKDIGQQINKLKRQAEVKFKTASHRSGNSTATSASQLDVSKPAEKIAIGAHHPLSIVRREIVAIFEKIGFTVSEGPEIEDDRHNFSALNFPPEHPARDMQDTFFVEKGERELALRTHTSSVQIRVMENGELPIRTLSPGRVYRNEAISARSHCFFHQVEGLYIDEGVSFADLKQTLLYFVQEMFGSNTQIRLRPSYFPFTEPSAELDVSCTICQSKGCNVCKYTGWLEILGCGMVDPNVLETTGIDPRQFSGFAFGMGIERIAQLKFRVDDIRQYSENDLRFLDQFKSIF